MKQQDLITNYVGKLCRYNHAYDGEQRSLRNIKSNACVECERIRQQRPEYKEKRRQYYEENKPDILAHNLEKYHNQKQYFQDYYYNNRDLILKKAKEKREREKQKEQITSKPRIKKEKPKQETNPELRRLYQRIAYQNKKNKKLQDAIDNS